MKLFFTLLFGVLGIAIADIGQLASQEIGALYRGDPEALAMGQGNALPSSTDTELIPEGTLLSQSSDTALVPSSGGAAIGCLEHKVLHALTGAATGALLNEENRRAGALWGAIGAAGSEMLMEAVYDPRERSRVIIQDMAEDLREGRIQLSGDNQMAELRQTFETALRRDVERTRDIVRTGMAFGSLALGAQSREINILDDTAYRAVTHNFMWSLEDLTSGVFFTEGPIISGARLRAAGGGGMGIYAGCPGGGVQARGPQMLTNQGAQGSIGSGPKGGSGQPRGGQGGGSQPRATAPQSAPQPSVPRPLKDSAQPPFNGRIVPYRGSQAISSKSPNAQDALSRKFKALDSAKRDAVEIRTLPDGRIRYHERERAAATPGPTRGHSFTTEYNPATGRVRTWEEGRDHSGNVIRVHPKMIDGINLNAPHYPPTRSDYEKFFIKKPKLPGDK